MKRFALAVLLLAAAGTVIAGQDSGVHDYAHSAAGRRLVKRLHEKRGISPATTRRLLSAAHFKPAIVAKMRNPPEKRLTWAQYRPIFVQPDRAREGARYIAAHRKLFEQARRRYGVPPAVVAAILGVETRYGQHIGHYRVLDALATLAFDYPPRSKYFTRELAEFITLCSHEKLDCTHDVGSYAGAMGLGQFMPSSYAAYAVDGNDDGKRDLWHQPADIIDSVANYLAENGWKRGASMAQPAHAGHADVFKKLTTSTRHTHYAWSALAGRGVTVAHPPKPSARVGLVKLTGPHGPAYWVAGHNFFVITTYNASPLYAMAVDQLARAIATRVPPANGS